MDVPRHDRDHHERHDRWAHWLALAVILALALGLRLYRLNAQSLWNDEGTSVALALRSLATITRHASQDIHPPLYYYLLHFWMSLFGDSELAVRSLSALTGTGLVLATYILARRLSGRGPALIAALLSAVSPFQIYYSQETRMYILVSLFCALSVGVYLRWLRRAGLMDDSGSTARPSPWARRGTRIGYMISSLTAVYCHYIAFSVVLAQNIGFIVQAISRGRLPWQRGGWRLWLEWAGMQLIVVLGYVPWLLLSWRSLSNWPSVSASLSLRQLLSRVAVDFALGMTRADLGTMVVTVIAATYLAVLLLGHLPLKERHRETGRFPLVLVLYLWIPIATIYGLSLQRPMYKPKFLLLATPAYYMLIARGVAQVAGWLGRIGRARWRRIVACAGLCLVLCGLVAPSLANLYWDPTTYRDDYRGIVTYVDATANPNDAILINAPSQIETVSYYYHGMLPMVPLPRTRPPDREATERELGRLVAQHERLYCIFWATDESDRERIVETWLDTHCFKAMDSWFGNVRLVVYATPTEASAEIEHTSGAVWGNRIELLGYTLLTPEPSSGQIMQITLHWKALVPIEGRYKVFVHLVDGHGNIVGQRDSEPGGGAQPTNTWQAGQIIRDNHGLVVSPASPTGPHMLRIGLYSMEDGARLPIIASSVVEGDALDLAEVVIRSPDTPPPLGALDIQERQDICWSGLCLLGYRWHRLGYDHAPDTPIRPGDAVSMVLFWSRAEGHVQDAVTVSLVGSNRREAWRATLRIAEGGDPVASWRQGDIVRDMHVLHLPPDLPAGRYRLMLAPTWDGDVPQKLGNVTISP